MKKLLILSCTILLLTSCYTQHATSIITSIDYDSKEDKTNCIYLPYGGVALPGKWVKTKYDSNSKQQFFTNQDSVSIAIAFGPCNKFEFNADGSKQGFEFLEAFYNWESKYFIEEHKLLVEKIDEDKNHILWHVESEDRKIDTYFLFGVFPNSTFSNFSIQATKKWSRDQKIEFMKNIYLNESN
jgi:hypothetical protein